MAKKETPTQEEGTSWSADEVAILLQDLEAKGEVIADLQKKMDRVLPMVEQHHVELNALSPAQIEVPAEVLKGIRPDLIFANILQGLIIGSIQVYGIQATDELWESLTAKIATKAEKAFSVVMERYVRQK